jgi:hypothetical protein
MLPGFAPKTAHTDRMTVTDEALSTLTRRIGIAHLASSLCVTAYLLSPRIPFSIAVVATVAFALLALLLTACVLMARRRAVDEAAKRRAAQPFWWFFGAQASFTAQFSACIAYMHFTHHILP